nr:Hsp20/alpha crystallin family protein [Halovivax gelatinilyticus]
MVRTYEYDGESVVAVDLSGLSDDPAVDVVDGTAIVVFDDRQFEIDLPDGANDAHTFIKNGVLSIEVEANR